MGVQLLNELVDLSSIESIPLVGKSTLPGHHLTLSIPYIQLGMIKKFAFTKIIILCIDNCETTGSLIINFGLYDKPVIPVYLGYILPPAALLYKLSLT